MDEIYLNIETDVIDINISQETIINIDDNKIELAIETDAIDINITQETIINIEDNQIELNLENNIIEIEAPAGAYPFPIDWGWWDYIIKKLGTISKTSVLGGYVYEFSYIDTDIRRYRYVSVPYDAALDKIYKFFINGVVSFPVAERLKTLL